MARVAFVGSVGCVLREGAGIEPGNSVTLVIERLRVQIPAGVAVDFSSPQLTLCADFQSVSVPPPVLPQWHVKDPGHSAKSVGGRLHLRVG